jgi:hypothetical protein
LKDAGKVGRDKSNAMSKGSLVDAAPDSPREARTFDKELEHVRQALAGLQFGEVSIIVQDGVIVQVERIERKRFRRGK